MLASLTKALSFARFTRFAHTAATNDGGRSTRKEPKKFERTPVGRLEDEEALKKQKETEEQPRRRLVNPETGEIGGPPVGISFTVKILLFQTEPTKYGDWSFVSSFNLNHCVVSERTVHRFLGAKLSYFIVHVNIFNNR